MELVCAMHEAAKNFDNTESKTAITIIKGIAVCQSCLSMILTNENRTGDSIFDQPVKLTGDEYIEDALVNGV